MVHSNTNGDLTQLARLFAFRMTGLIFRLFITCYQGLIVRIHMEDRISSGLLDIRRTLTVTALVTVLLIHVSLKLLLKYLRKIRRFERETSSVATVETGLPKMSYINIRIT